MRKKLIVILLVLVGLTYYVTTTVSAQKESLYLDTNNEVIWARGVHDIKVKGNKTDFVCEPYSSGGMVFHEYYSKFDSTKGYYDINKTDDSEKDDNLCFAVSASNALTWWLRENESLVNSYLEETPDVSFVEEIKKFQQMPIGQYDSNIFNHFVAQYAYRKEGYWPDILIDHFLNGYKPKENGGVNDEDWDGDILLENGPSRGGGFFFDLLGKKKLSNRMHPSYNDFSKIVKESLLNESLVMMTYDMVAYAHVVTVWGAEFDKNGNLYAVYYSDSDDARQYGLKRVRVINKANLPYITTEINNKASSLVSTISTLSLGRRYFNSHEHIYGEPQWNYDDPNNVTATFICKDDPSHIEVVNASVLPHVIDSTCKKVGESYKIAKVNFNNKVYTSNKFDLKDIPLKEHIYSEYVIEKIPTCTTDGKKVKTCKNCSEKQEEIIPKIEHQYGDYFIKVNPTCHSEGYKVKKCTLCSHEIEEIIPKLAHDFTDYEVVIKESCLSEGLLSRHCKNCDVIDSKKVPKLDHVSDNVYYFENDYHYHKCLNGCNTKLNYEHCSGGKATIFKEPLCEVCKHRYGFKLENKEILDKDLVEFDSSSNDLIYHKKGDILIEIRINDKVLAKENYVLNEDSIIVKGSFLNSLKSKNKIVLQFEDGYVTIDYNLRDNKLIIITSSVIASIVLISVTSLFIYRKKKHS